jgi:hypothetical protein
MAGGSQGSRACLLTASALRKNGVSKGKGVVRARFSLPLLISHPMSFPSTTAPAKPKVDVCCVLLRCSCMPTPIFSLVLRAPPSVMHCVFDHVPLQLQVLFCVFYWKYLVHVAHSYLRTFVFSLHGGVFIVDPGSSAAAKRIHGTVAIAIVK